MKKSLLLLVAAFSCISLTSQAQMGGSGSPDFSDMTDKFFGEHTTFEAAIEVTAKAPNAPEPLVMNGRMAVLDKKTRFEMNFADTKGGGLPPNAAEQMKQMGMDRTVIISRPDRQTSYLIYPGLNAYAELPLKESGGTNSGDYQIGTLKLGVETIDGHECDKNKVSVTNKLGKVQQATVWNARDLKNFPIQIETEQKGNPVKMKFKGVKFEKPAAAQFDPPADCTRYENVQALMQKEVMKRMMNQAAPR